jgi:SAM-dependent methyltransferase
MKLQDIGNKLHSDGIFTGGPPQYFESAGRLQLSTLVREGLYPDSKVLDVGCGCLRAGYWLIRLLDPGCYFGIEPSEKMLSAGIGVCLTPGVQTEKRPHFDNNDQFDFSVFGVKFDVVLARSIWSHASKSQIEAMLDGFVEHSTPHAFFLTSYLPAVWFKRWQRDYTGENWVGKSHKRDRPGQIHHSLKWIELVCEERGLVAKQLPDEPFNSQYWLKVTKHQRLRKSE